MKGIGVIGTGNMGSGHVRRLATRVSGAWVAAVFDVDRARAEAAAQGTGAVVHASAQDVVDDPSVDAVVVAAPGAAHTELTLACFDAQKPVLCEKPLAPTALECQKLMEAEAANGARSLVVGFMRRFDNGYTELKKTIDSGDIGVVLLVHCVHRNAVAPSWFKSEMSFTESLVHELDVTRWLLGEELVAAAIVPVRQSPFTKPDLHDPVLVVLESSSGVVGEVEVFVNCQYGYDVRCEVVGAKGAASLEMPVTGATTRSGARAQPVPVDWLTRFGGAYLDELQFWVDDLHAGTCTGPSAWDGYAAAAGAQACLRSLESGQRAPISLVDRPAIYA